MTIGYIGYMGYMIYMIYRIYGNHKRKTCSRYTKVRTRQSSQSITRQKVLISQRKRARKEETGKGSTKQFENNTMAIVNCYPPIITLNINRLNLQLKTMNGRMEEKTNSKDILPINNSL